MFSNRVPGDLRPNAYALARAERGRVPYDLTVTNPTACGLDYPRDLLDALSAPEGLIYRPEPKGLRSAREAIAAEYLARGVAVDPERIVLAASSSEAYGFLFKLLCAPGDCVLVPTPSYPLFEHLAALDGVRAVSYALDPGGGWQPHPPSGRREPPARAAVLVHPNNPTGTWVDAVAAEGLAASGGEPIPLIVDEVFLDYPLAPDARATTFATRASGLTFTLGGLSKSRGLPQLKLSWIVVGGPGAVVHAALDALEFIADTYLSVATPVQLALPRILAASAPVRDAILARCRENLARARELARGAPWAELVVPGGGWSLATRFPRVIPEETLVLDLLRRDGVAVHPGYFFDFPTDGYFVVSLLPPPETFAAGFELALEAIRRGETGTGPDS